MSKFSIELNKVCKDIYVNDIGIFVPSHVTLETISLTGPGKDAYAKT